MPPSSVHFDQGFIASIYRRTAEFFLYAAEASEMMALIDHGLHSILYSRQLRRKAKSQLPDWTAEEEAQNQAFEKLGNEAQRVIDEGYPILHANSLVGIWGAAEAAVEDIAALWIQARPDLQDIPAVQKIKVSLGPFLSLDRNAQARFLIREIQQQVGADSRIGTGQFDSLLGPLGLSGPVNDDVRKDVRAAQQMRHLIAHRAGVVDGKFLEACPDLGYSEGERIAVTSDQLLRYIGALAEYVHGIGAWVEEGTKGDPNMRRLHEGFKATYAGAKAAREARPQAGPPLDLK